MNAVERTRKAATEIRDDWGGEGYGEHSPFMLAVADLLDALADDRERNPNTPLGFEEKYDAVVSAYLGADS